MLTQSQEQLLKAHREIDFLVRHSPLPFISGWSTAHRIDYEILKDHQAPAFTSDGAHGYSFLSDDPLLKEKICRFHQQVDGAFPHGCEVFIGAGSSPLISSLMIMLSLGGEQEILYASPIYHAYYYMAKTLGLRMTSVGAAVSGSGEEDVAGKLPDRKSVFIITDPSWISGRSFSDGFWASVREWQVKTGSLVIVDGTFQYTKWRGMECESASCLAPENTFRLVCPTKSLCIHGVRFAYFILPGRYTEDFGYIYSKLMAATSAFDVGVAHLMMDQLKSSRNNRGLVEYISHRYSGMVERGLIHEPVAEPNCTYYAFGKSGFDLSAVITMNGRYFELDYPDNFIRLNILSPDLPGEL